MQGVLSQIFTASVFILSGCSSNSFLKPQSELNSLRSHDTLRVVQVAANFDPSVKRDHPYFILCEESDCPATTKKTPLQFKSFKSQLGSYKNLNSAVVNKSDGNGVPSKGQNIEGLNTTYLSKESTLLSQFRVHFDYASAVINQKYKQLLESFVDEYPNKKSTLRITGFTDNDSKPDGTIGNEWLALERATGVKRHLIALGYPESQILLEAKFLCCYIDSNKTEEGRLNNRRAEITLLNFKSKGDSL